MAEHDKIYYTDGLLVPETPAPGEEPGFWKQTHVVGMDEYARGDVAKGFDAAAQACCTSPGGPGGQLLRSPGGGC